VRNTKATLILLVILGLLQTSSILPCEICTPRTQVYSLEQLRPDQGCSVIYATDGKRMLGGNNEDYIDPLTKVWFIPEEGESFGRVYFGFENYHAQGGMNDQGVFFDALALDDVYPVPTTGKQEYLGNLADKAMAECATVACVVDIFEHYFSSEVWSWQFFFGDATGESAIIEPQSIIRQQGGYQAATNFLQSAIPPEDISDRRYLAAIAGLQGIDDLTIESVAAVLDEVHVEGATHTIYSNVYDLNDKVIYLYYFHNYEDVVVLNLDEELAKGYHAYDLPSLFPPNEQAEKWAKPKLLQYDALVKSRLNTTLTPDIFQAYAGEYAMLEGWGAPDQTLSVIAQDYSLLLRFPDYHQHELFPASATEFYYVAFLGGEFAIAYDVRFGLDEDNQIRYIELTLGDNVFRGDRLGPKTVLPLASTPESTATSLPTATPEPTVTSFPTATPESTQTPEVEVQETQIVPLVELSPTMTLTPDVETPDMVIESDDGTDVMPLWLIGLLVVLGALFAGILIRKRS
jgi:hypothetical protein